MGIRVIQQTTAERKEEILQLYEKVKPLLDDGIGLWTAVKTVRGKPCSTNVAWYRELRMYCRQKGYDCMGGRLYEY